MKDLKALATNMMFESAIEKMASSKGITIAEAKELMLEMSFSDYLRVLEDITPPSGNTIGPTSATAGSTQQGTAPNSQVKSIWPGKGAPVEMGMTVGLKGANGMPIPGQISQVDASAKGVKVKNPTTGQDEWVNMDALQPYMASGNGQSPAAGTNTSASNTTDPSAVTTQEDANDLVRLRELAGIKENCSAGATGAGSIAVAPAAMGTMRKRQATDEEVKKEYTRKEAAKTIVGDTKPAQASGELSANLAARGKKAAGRINNGFKR